MAITLSREAYLEFRCFGMADQYPKDVRAAVTELRRRGYDASVASLQAAKKQGASGLRTWLKSYGQMVQDPRKAWIELDYCVMVSREDLPEARRVFAEVKARTSPASPVWPRVKDLEKTYE